MISGVVIQWPDGQYVTLQQSPWIETTLGWTSVVTIPRVYADRVTHYVAQLSIAEHEAHDGTKANAIRLIADRLQRIGPDTPVHLGEIHISRPDFTL